MNLQTNTEPSIRPVTIILAREKTGVFWQIVDAGNRNLIGIEGEEVYRHGWGGIDLELEDGTMVTLSIGDVKPI